MRLSFIPAQVSAGVKRIRQPAQGASQGQPGTEFPGEIAFIFDYLAAWKTPQQRLPGHVPELLDLRGKLASENKEKVIYTNV